MLAMHFSGQKVHLLIGMLDGKDPKSLIEPMQSVLESVTAVPVSGRPSHTATDFGGAATDAKDLPAAMASIPDDGLPVLIGGSLYLAGEALKLNEEVPS